MAATREELGERLARVEQKVTRLQQQVEKPPISEIPAERGRGY